MAFSTNVRPVSSASGTWKSLCGTTFSASGSRMARISSSFFWLPEASTRVSMVEILMIRESD
jgi:hypothetical protein